MDILYIYVIFCLLRTLEMSHLRLHLLLHQRLISFLHHLRTQSSLLHLLWPPRNPSNLLPHSDTCHPTSLCLHLQWTTSLPHRHPHPLTTAQRPRQTSFHLLLQPLALVHCHLLHHLWATYHHHLPLLVSGVWTSLCLLHHLIQGFYHHLHLSQCTQELEESRHHLLRLRLHLLLPQERRCGLQARWRRFHLLRQRGLHQRCKEVEEEEMETSCQNWWWPWTRSVAIISLSLEFVEYKYSKNCHVLILPNSYCWHPQQY